jgi:hypothetical protein
VTKKKRDEWWNNTHTHTNAAIALGWSCRGLYLMTMNLENARNKFRPLLFSSYLIKGRCIWTQTSTVRRTVLKYSSLVFVPRTSLLQYDTVQEQYCAVLASLTVLYCTICTTRTRLTVNDSVSMF